MDDNDHSLIPLPDGSLANTAAGTKRILSGMVEDEIALGREEALARTDRFRIGDYIWCEPDYRQILLWAEALKMEPSRFIAKLVAGRDGSGLDYGILTGVTTRFQDGRMIALFWNLDELPLSDFICIEGLIIEELFLYEDSARATECTEVRPITLYLPTLRSLSCDCCRIETLSLSGISNLTRLDCSENQLTELDLSHVPKLTNLICSHNQLTELDLSHVPKLTNLICSHNQLTELELSQVPNLTFIDCSRNQLTELDLTQVPNLTFLACSRNQLKEFDLIQVPNLISLYCYNNQIAELDIRPLHALKYLGYHPDKSRLMQRPDQNF